MIRFAFKQSMVECSNAKMKDIIVCGSKSFNKIQTTITVNHNTEKTN